MDFLDELGDEVKDFFEDFWEHLTEGKVVRKKELGTGIRPAYLFAERIDNLVRLIFGASIIISAITATFLGFSTLSELLNFLIDTFWGRAIMLVIGLSYFILAAYHLLHLKNESQK